jgi:hypothetical protein
MSDLGSESPKRMSANRSEFMGSHSNLIMLRAVAVLDDGNENGAREGRRPSSWPGLDQAALVLRWPNMICLASSSISALKVNLSFSAIARAAAGLAETSSTSRFTL